MADILITVNGVFDKRYRDMGDGTFAEVVFVGAAGDLTLSENPGVNIGDVGLLTGGNLIGEVGIDQTDPGTTNKVVADPATATPVVYNVTLTLADTEYSQIMPVNCRAFEFQCRTAFDVRYQYVTGRVATPTAPYMTMKSGGAVESGPINQGASPSTLYLASSQAGVVVEITAWV